MILNLLKLGCLLVYAGALAGLAGLVPPGPGQLLQNLALVMLGLHVVEMAFVFPALRRYRGPLALSVLLGLLFGLLHWLSLRRLPA